MDIVRGEREREKWGGGLRFVPYGNFFTHLLRKTGSCEQELENEFQENLANQTHKLWKFVWKSTIFHGKKMPKHTLKVKNPCTSSELGL